MTGVTQRDDSLTGPGPLNTFKQFRYKADRRVSGQQVSRLRLPHAQHTEQTGTHLPDVKDRLLSVRLPISVWDVFLMIQ